MAEQMEVGDEREFVTIKQALDWMDRNGWNPRHGGGYWRGGRGYATMFAAPSDTSDQPKVVFKIHKL